MAHQIETVALHEATQERYLNYALSVITSRALPDVRDGLKPVQRRILYAMFANLRLTHDSKHRKSAAVVGEVMAKYHPHGDQAIYDAMVRMAQSFSLRYPLVDGQGNFGSLDGDPAAAMRYTEARLREISEELIREIRKETVDFRANYDGQFHEPVVLPAQLPNLLLNGAMGIAVGMATNIPPHNLREVVKACIRLIEKPELTVADLVRTVKGPDFPTGGKLLNTPDEIIEMYETGSGAIHTAGEWELEKEGRTRYLVVKSIPFAVNKATLIEKIADHIRAGKVPQLVDVRDESTDDVRIVLELSSRGNPQAAMAYLYKNTPLQTRFHVNLTCLVPDPETGVGAPARLSLKEILRNFLDFRFEVVTKRLTYDLQQVLKRIHLLEAFEKIFNDLDEALRIIRGSDGKKDAAVKLMARFELDAEQADAVLETRLYKLARLEIEAIKAELEEKRAEAARLQALLDSEEARWSIVKEELKALNKKYGDKRRTAVDGPEEELEYNAEDYIVRENTVVIITRAGWLKRQRSYSEVSTIRVRENDEVGWIFSTKTHETVTYFTDRGKAYTMLADEVPQTTGYGDPVTAYFDFEDGERIVGAMCSDARCWPDVVERTPDKGEEDEEDEAETTTDGAPEPELQIVAITRSGYGVRVGPDTFQPVSNKAGRYYVRLADKCDDGSKDGVVCVFPTNLSENVCLVSHGGRAIIFKVTDLRFSRGRSRGVRAIKLDKTDTVLAFRLSTKKREGLEVETNRGRQEIVRTTKYAVTKRGGKGRAILLRGFIAKVVLPTIEFHREDEEEEEEEEEEIRTGPLSAPISAATDDAEENQPTLFALSEEPASTDEQEEDDLEPLEDEDVSS